MAHGECPIAKLLFDAQIWPRLQRDEARIAHLADVLQAGGKLPPVKVQRHTAFVLGGWHTVAAYQRLQRDHVPVETVDIGDADPLLYAYLEDVAGPLTYTDADVRSVARRLYQRRSNGHGANVAALARDLGRLRQTVASWVEDLVAADESRGRCVRAGRAVAVQAFRGAHCTHQAIADLFGTSKATVVSEAKISIADHLHDQAVIDAARGFIAATAARGSTPGDRQAANDWLLQQINPTALREARHLRALNQVIEWTRATSGRVDTLQIPPDLAGAATSTVDLVRDRYRELVTDLAHLRKLTAAVSAAIEGKAQHESPHD